MSTLSPDFLCGQTWRALPMFPRYLISESGDVVSMVKATPEKLRPSRLGKYVGLTLKCANGTFKRFYLHRLVAEAFHGDPTEAAPCCRHIDGDRTNNHWTNLAWGTYSDNYADAKRHGTACVGERHHQARLTEGDVLAMRDHRARTGESYRKIAERFGVTTMTAYRAVTGKCWADV